jgi:hypothetical protein
MREAYRTQRTELLELARVQTIHLHLAMVYMDRDLCDFPAVQKATGQLLDQLKRQLEKSL